MLTYIFDTMTLKVIFLLNCESSKYIAKLFSLSIYARLKIWTVDVCCVVMSVKLPVFKEVIIYDDRKPLKAKLSLRSNVSPHLMLYIMAQQI